MKHGNTHESWGEVARALHWIGALLVFVLLAHGWWMVTIGDREPRLAQFGWHASIGYALLTLLIARLLWRWMNPVPAAPVGTSTAERVLAGSAHVALYLLMLALALSGWALAGTFRQPLDASLFGIVSVPAIASPANRDLHELLEDVHAWLAWPLAALIGLHIIAAFYHALIRKDGVLQRMLPGGLRQ